MRRDGHIDCPLQGKRTGYEDMAGVSPQVSPQQKRRSKATQGSSQCTGMARRSHRLPPAEGEYLYQTYDIGPLTSGVQRGLEMKDLRYQDMTIHEVHPMAQCAEIAQAVRT